LTGTYALDEDSEYLEVRGSRRGVPVPPESVLLRRRVGVLVLEGSGSFERTTTSTKYSPEGTPEVSSTTEAGDWALSDGKLSLRVTSVNGGVVSGNPYYWRYFVEKQVLFGRASWIVCGGPGV
jgi:hypothetical protein